jgi:hypothetical protein
MNGISDVPHTIASAAPNDAAEERPRVNGLTRGLRKEGLHDTTCYGKLIPVKIAKNGPGHSKINHNCVFQTLRPPMM